MNIRKIIGSDVLELNQLHESLFSQGFNFTDYAEEKPFHYGIIFEDKGKIIGYLVGQLIFEMGDLFYIAVDSHYRGNGIGIQLMNFFMKDAKSQGVEAISLEVRLSNEAAISLYKRCGFQQIGTRKNYYADGEDAALMVCHLI